MYQRGESRGKGRWIGYAFRLCSRVEGIVEGLFELPCVSARGTKYRTSTLTCIYTFLLSFRGSATTVFASPKQSPPHGRTILHLTPGKGYQAGWIAHTTPFGFMLRGGLGSRTNQQSCRPGSSGGTGSHRVWPSILGFSGKPTDAHIGISSSQTKAFRSQLVVDYMSCTLGGI